LLDEQAPLTSASAATIVRIERPDVMSLTLLFLEISTNSER
jgi:hypothetical protein